MNRLAKAPNSSAATGPGSEGRRGGSRSVSGKGVIRPGGLWGSRQTRGTYNPARVPSCRFESLHGHASSADFERWPTELQAPAPHSLVRTHDASLREQVFYVSKFLGDPMVEPDGDQRPSLFLRREL